MDANRRISAIMSGHAGDEAEQHCHFIEMIQIVGRESRSRVDVGGEHGGTGCDRRSVSDLAAKPVTPLSNRPILPAGTVHGPLSEPVKVDHAAASARLTRHGRTLCPDHRLARDRSRRASAIATSPTSRRATTSRRRILSPPSLPSCRATALRPDALGLHPGLRQRCCAIPAGLQCPCRNRAEKPSASGPPFCAGAA